MLFSVPVTFGAKKSYLLKICDYIIEVITSGLFILKS